MSKAFDHITQFSRKRLVNIKLKKVAQYAYLRKKLLSFFKRLKDNYLNSRSLKRFIIFRKCSLQYKFLKQWKLEYLRNDITKKLLARRTVNKLYFAFNDARFCRVQYNIPEKKFSSFTYHIGCWRSPKDSIYHLKV